MSDAPLSYDYRGRTVMVTGAASGISRATALAFAAAGANVFAIDRNVDGLAATIETIRSAGGSAEAHSTDITVGSEMDEAVAACVARFDRLDCAFNGAGVGSPIAGTILDYEESHWDQVMNVNLKGMFFCLKAQIRQMIAQGEGGAIVNVASIGGVRGTPKASAYIASKHGVIGLTRVVAMDHAGDGIRINALCPGFIAGTPMMDAFIAKDPEVRTAHMAATIPLGRLGDVRDMAETALWLCSDGARYVTGATLMADGGQTAG